MGRNLSELVPAAPKAATILKNSAAISDARFRSNALARLAFDALSQILSDRELPAHVRTSAALAILRHGKLEKNGDLLDLAARVYTQLDNLTPHLDTNLTLKGQPLSPQWKRNQLHAVPTLAAAGRVGAVKDEEKTLDSHGGIVAVRR